MHLGQHPDYAPDVSPEEGIGRYLKKGGRKNGDLKSARCEQIGALKRQRRLVFERLCHETEVITGGVDVAGLDLSPPMIGAVGGVSFVFSVLSSSSATLAVFSEFAR
ncbi:MAG: hypothetical protein BRD53_03905 [Bacteroidetes bacterium SW_7_64_58]|nr:MAG: hypothetical protein BRD53_03905 [Bacteroidetes bacterium SW_7_64_58]